MSIYVEVRNQRGEILTELEGFQYQPLVSWEHRERFPMLGLIDPLGMTMFNRPQIRELRIELNSIEDRLSQDGPLAVSRELGLGEAPQLGRIEGWNLELDYAPLVRKLRLACDFATAKYHRYLWLIGD